MEDATRPGRLVPVALSLPEGSFLLRLPDDLPASRIVFTEVLPDAAGNAVRRALGSHILP